MGSQRVRHVWATKHSTSRDAHLSDNKQESDHLKNPDNGNSWGAEVGSVPEMGPTENFSGASRVLHLGRGSKGVCLICWAEQAFYVVFLYVSYFTIKRFKRDLSGGPVVKNLPSSTGDEGLIPDWRAKIPHAAGQLSPSTTTREAGEPQRNVPHAATRIWCDQINK